MAIDKLNKTFESGQKLLASEMNQISDKIDELVDGVTTNESNIPDVSGLVGEAPKDGKSYVRNNGQWSQLPEAGEGGTIVVDSELSDSSVNPVQNKAIKKYVDERTTELNISSLFPTQGIGGTNKYDLTTAIAQVPAEYQRNGLKIIFVNESGNTECWEWNGIAFSYPVSWKRCPNREELIYLNSQFGFVFLQQGDTGESVKQGEKIYFLCLSKNKETFPVYISGNPSNSVSITEENIIYQLEIAQNGTVVVGNSSMPDLSVELYMIRESGLFSCIRYLYENKKITDEQFKGINETLLNLPISEGSDNIIIDGDFKTLNNWETTVGTINDIGGIDIISPKGIILKSKYLIDIDEDTDISALIEAENNLSSNCDITLTFLDVTSIYQGVFTLKNGYNLLHANLERLKNQKSQVKVYVNCSVECNITIKNIIALKNTDSELLQQMFKALGYSNIYKYTLFAKHAVGSPSNEDFKGLMKRVENLEGNTSPILLKAYFSSDSVQEGEGVFVGTVGNKNALQRAIESIDNNTGEQYIIKVFGNLTVSQFADFSAIDELGRDYKAVISLAGKRNIKIIGTNNIISANLPTTGISDYSHYQVLSYEGKNCELHNMTFELSNGRYPLHYEINANNIMAEFKNTTMKAFNCKFIHRGNKGDAYTQWPSTTGVGIGFSAGVKLEFYDCLYSSIGGHDGYSTDEHGEVICINCQQTEMGTDIGVGFNFQDFGQEGSYSKYTLINCNHTASKLILNKRLTHYSTINGYGNSKFIVECTDDYFPNFSDCLSYFYAKNESIEKYTAVDKFGNKSNGNIHYISIDRAEIGESFRAVTNTYLKAADIISSVSSGDYIEAVSGVLTKTDKVTNCKVISIKGILYLDLSRIQ